MSILRTRQLPDRIPPLESGDRLTRPEFERRYAVMPPNVKAELVEGIVYTSIGVRAQTHGMPHGEIVAWVGTYRVYTPGIRFGDSASVRLDWDNEPQPDLCGMIEHDGQTRIDEDGIIEGAPELIGEVAASSASYDLGDKLKAYR